MLDFRRFLGLISPAGPSPPGAAGNRAASPGQGSSLHGGPVPQACLVFIPLSLHYSLKGAWLLQDDNAVWHPISQHLPSLPTFLPQPSRTSMFN